MKNRKAYFNYELIDKYIAGIVLVGTEVKSIKNGQINFNDSYCFINEDNEIFIKNMHISELKNSIYNHEPTRDRKLLLTKKQIKKLKEKVRIGNYTIVPTNLFQNEKGFFKLEIYLAKGKKEYDKKNKILEKDIDNNKKFEVDNY